MTSTSTKRHGSATPEGVGESATDSQAAFQLDPDEVRAYLRQGKPLKDLVGLGDQIWETMYEFGYHSFKNGQFAMAEYWWQHASLFDPLRGRNWISLGVACVRQQKYEEALNAFSLAVRNGSDNPWAPLHAAECHLRRDDIAKATKALECAESWAGNSDEHELILKRIAMLRRGISKREGFLAADVPETTADPGAPTTL